MIPREIAHGLGPIVNNTKLFHTGFLPYIVYRIAELHKQLEMADDLSEVKRIQGAIKELRKFFTLDAAAQKVIKDNAGNER